MSDYNKLTVVEIRAELKTRGIALTGLTRKQQMIERLETDDQAQQNASTAPAPAPAAPVVEAEAETEVGTEGAAEVEPQNHDNAQKPEEEHDDMIGDDAAAMAKPAGAMETKATAVGIELTDQEKQKEGEERPSEKTEGSASEDEKGKEMKEETSEEIGRHQLQEENQTKQLEAHAIQPVDMAQKESKITVANNDDNNNDSAMEGESTVVEQPLRAQNSVQSAAPQSMPSTPPTTGTSEDSRKRKRRSSSPAPTASEIKKRLKHDSNDAIDRMPAVHLREDDDDDERNEDTVQPHEDGHAQEDSPMIDDQTLVPSADEQAHKDAEMDDSSKSHRDEDPKTSADELPPTSDEQENSSQPQNTTHSAAHRESRDHRYKDLFSPLDASRPSRAATTIGATNQGDEGVEQTDDGEDRDMEPAKHPATAALYIKNFMRPLQLPALKDHLISLAHRRAQDGDDNEDQPEVIQQIHLDGIRTHCFVLFSSVAAAARVRSSLHDRVWPQERTRKPLWVDFIPEDKVGDWIAEEEQSTSGSGARSSKRWEVVYHHQDDGSVTASLQDGAGFADPVAREVAPRPTDNSSSRGVAGRVKLPPSPQMSRESGADRLSTSKAGEAAPSASFLALDSLFKFTRAKPKLYFQPVSARTAGRRLDALDDATSRRFRDDVAGGVAHQYFSNAADMRRYTFEDEDYLVDNGPEFGLRQGRRGGGRVRARDGPFAPPPHPLSQQAPFGAPPYKTGRRSRGGGGYGDIWRSR